MQHHHITASTCWCHFTHKPKGNSTSVCSSFPPSHRVWFLPPHTASLHTLPLQKIQNVIMATKVQTIFLFFISKPKIHNKAWQKGWSGKRTLWNTFSWKLPIITICILQFSTIYFSQSFSHEGASLIKIAGWSCLQVFMVSVNNPRCFWRNVTQIRRAYWVLHEGKWSTCKYKGDTHILISSRMILARRFKEDYIDRKFWH